jgi:hypothetical protein
MLKFNYKELNKKAVFCLRMFFVAAAFFVSFVIASDPEYSRERSNPVKITHRNNNEIASSSQTSPRNDIFKIFAPIAQAQGVAIPNNSGLANNAGLDDISGQVNLPETDIRTFVFRLINIALSLIGIILVGLFVYGGWLWMTSEGDPQKINQAKAIFKNAAIGLAIILSSFAIVNFILKALWGGGGGGATVPEMTYDVGVTALGDGIIESHYPARGQADVPRNTMIIITFKEALDPNTICSAAICDGKTNLNTENISIFSSSAGGESNGDANDAKDTAKISSAKVETTDNKTFIFRPDKFLGSESTEQWYGVRLFGGKLKKSNGDDVKLGVADYYQWKFQVSTRLDLTPPQVQSIFPLPDNKQDTKIAADNAVQAKWTITINSAPVEYKKSGAKIDPAVEAATLTGAYQNCSGSDTVKFKVGTGTTGAAVGKIAVVLEDGGKTKGFNGESIILNNKADIGCGLSLNFSSIPAGGTPINIKVIAEQAGDKISIDGQDYVFGKEIKTGGSNGIVTALKDNQLINAQAHAALPQVILTAKTDKLPGAQGNDIEISVSNPASLALTKIIAGKDKEEGYKTNDQPDQPRNAVIQINFNEAMNPIQLQGDLSAVKNYIQVLNIAAPIEGIFTVSNNYKTVEFKTKTECGENSCGEKKYCLPAFANIKVWVKAASLITCVSNEECVKTSGNNLNFGVCGVTAPKFCQQEINSKKINYPQASAAMDGAMDAAANSLDGNRDDNAQGPVSDYDENTKDKNLGDNFSWSFFTSDKIDLESPIIESAKSKDLNLVKVEVGAGKQAVGAGVTEPVSFLFNKIMMSSSLKPGRNYPDDFYFNPDPKIAKVQREYFIFMNFSQTPLGYWVGKDDIMGADGFPEKTTAVIGHTTLGENGAYGFVIGSGAKSIYQNCYNPAADKGDGGSTCGSGMSAGDSCCKGIKNSTEEKCYKF